MIFPKGVEFENTSFDREWRKAANNMRHLSFRLHRELIWRGLVVNSTTGKVITKDEYLTALLIGMEQMKDRIPVC